MTAGRLTHYRKAVLEVLRATHTHPTAAEVFRTVRRRRPGVAYATIYNALNWLVQSGLISRITFSDQAARYDANIKRHDHLICHRCGALRDITLRLSPSIWSRAGHRDGFRVERYHTELFGLCGRCAGEEGARPRRRARRATFVSI
jgi:Fur family peroxide stress response transcriptional regulator